MLMTIFLELQANHSRDASLHSKKNLKKNFFWSQTAELYTKILHFQIDDFCKSLRFYVLISLKNSRFYSSVDKSTISLDNECLALEN